MLKPTQLNSNTSNALLIAGILCIAFNLRPAIATVGPLIGEIRDATGLSNPMLGLLTTLPLIAFGVVSSLTSLVTRRIGIGYTLLMALAIISAGILIRSGGHVFLLFFGTALFGSGIALGNVLLPSLIKQNFPSRSGLMTSLYSAVMAVGASLAAGISVPISQTQGLGWKTTLGLWSVPAIIALLIWIPQAARFKKPVQTSGYLQSMRSMSRKLLAWKIAFFMGLQSMTFYIILAWLPEILQSRGLDPQFSGWMLSLSQATGILGSLLIPLWAARKQSQQGIVILLILLEVAGILGLLFAHSESVILWVSFIGFVLGGCFSLALLFIVLRSKDTVTTTELSGMAQSIGYLVAAVGPILFGKVFDLSGNWTIPLLLLIAVAAVKLYAGYGAAGNAKI